MARSGWLAENEQRDYPFLTRIDPIADNGVSGEPQQLIALPQEAIADFGAIMNPQAGYDDTSDSVYLHRIHRTGARLLYEFRTTALPLDGLPPQRLVFTRDTDVDEEFTTQWADASFLSESESVGHAWEGSASPNCATDLWRGFLTTGRYAELLDMLLDGETMYFAPGLWQAEPVRIQNLRLRHVVGINLCNNSRRHALLGDECDTFNPHYDDPDTVYVVAHCIQGHIELAEGWNTTIRQDDQNNRLTISAAVGAGAGLPCNEEARFPGEVPLGNSRLLTGGPSCEQVLKTINGKGGKNLVLRAGRGIEIYPHGPNTLVIDRSLHDFATCFTVFVSESSSLSSSAGGA